MLALFFSVCIRMTRALALFFFNDTATTEIYTLSLHDALPIFSRRVCRGRRRRWLCFCGCTAIAGADQDRKSTRLNSSHQIISYAVFCLQKKNIYRRHSCPDRSLPHTRHTTLHLSHSPTSRSRD